MCYSGLFLKLCNSPKYTSVDTWSIFFPNTSSLKLSIHIINNRKFRKTTVYNFCKELRALLFLSEVTFTLKNCIELSALLMWHMSTSYSVLVYKLPLSLFVGTFCYWLQHIGVTNEFLFFSVLSSSLSPEFQSRLRSVPWHKLYIVRDDVDCATVLYMLNM